MQTQPRQPTASTPPASTQQVLRQLTMVWADFESRLLKVPIVDRAMQQQLRLADYRTLLRDHYQIWTEVHMRMMMLEAEQSSSSNPADEGP